MIEYLFINVNRKNASVVNCVHDKSTKLRVNAYDDDCFEMKTKPTSPKKSHDAAKEAKQIQVKRIKTSHNVAKYARW